MLLICLHWNPEKVGFNTGFSNRIDKIPSKNEDKQEEGKVFFSCSFMWDASKRCGFRVGFLESYCLIKYNPHRNAEQLVF